ncbi:MAG TPA: MarC family protein [Candidatus Aquilonibacter sp.]|nr:MarC family protein [Candidatus Aquilonibacter sp.]
MKDALELWDSFFIAFSALLPLINPLGTALVFLGLVGDAPAATYRSLARKIAFNNIVFLGIIELLGSAILHFFGISLPIIQFAGGIVIASMGWSVLNQTDAPLTSDSSAGIQADPDTRLASFQQKTFYPFTFPITSGPGTLVVMLTLATRAEGRSLTLNTIRHCGLFLAVIVLSILVYVCYANAPRLTRAIPPATAHGILRVVAFILMCIGVQIAWNGLSTLLLSVLHP